MTYVSYQKHTSLKNLALKFEALELIIPSNKARGGAAVIIRESIKHYEELKYSINSIQASSVKVESKRYKFVVTALYSPPRHKIESNDYTKFLKTLGNKFIVGGDFNAKNKYWGSRFTLPKGRELLKSGKSLQCEFVAGSGPSYWPTDLNKQPDVIDIFIVKGLSTNYMKAESCYDLSSDHTL